MGVSNLEARIKRLENTSSNEFGNPTNSILYPVRKLMLTEEVSHDEDGVAFSVLVATWDKPAGLIFPETIRLIHNGTTVSLAGTATSYRMPGYLIGDTVTVNVTAMYLQGASSTVTAVKTITGDATPPSMPTNLTVTGGFRTLTLRWENPTTEDFSHVEIWESITDNNIATAERIAQAYGTEFVRSNCAVLETRWFWIRALDVNGNFSDFTSVASGTTTAIAMEDVPENTISESMLISELASEINKIPAIEGDINLINTVNLPAYEQRIANRIDEEELIAQGLVDAMLNDREAKAKADSALAIAESKLYAHVSDEMEAEAGQRLLLAAKVDNNLSAIQSEATARANADSAMASQIATLQATAGDNTAAIQIVEDVRMGEVNVFRQASAPTTGMITGDLWIDNTEVVHRYEGGEWVSKEGTPVYDLLKTAIAQYVVKTQTVTGDGKLKVAGFGLYNDSTTGSEFAVLADKFYVYAQKEDGSSYSNMQVFTVDATTTPPTVGINGNLIVDGSIVGEKIYSGAKIQLGDGGEFITGANSIVQMASGVITLDSEGGIIQVRDPANVSTGDFVKIETGDITTYKYLDGSYRSMKSLRKMYGGVGAANGTTITLPGYWPSMPEIMVSPCALQTYYGARKDANQTLNLSATNITWNNNTGIVTFKPVAVLSISAGNLSLTPPAPNSATTSSSGGTVLTGAASTAIGVSSVTITAGFYGQYVVQGEPNVNGAYHKYGYGTVNFSMYAVVNGTNYLMGTGSTRGSLGLSGEPGSSTYVSKSITVSGLSAAPTISIRVTYTVTGISYGDYEPTKDAAVYNKCWVKMNSASAVTVSDEVLASGTLNYMAIAE